MIASKALAPLALLAYAASAQDVPAETTERELENVEEQYERAGFDEALPGKHCFARTSPLQLPWLTMTRFRSVQQTPRPCKHLQFSITIRRSKKAHNKTPAVTLSLTLKLS